MFGFAYGGLTEGGQGSSHSAYAQQVLFSIFCYITNYQQITRKFANYQHI